MWSPSSVLLSSENIIRYSVMLLTVLYDLPCSTTTVEHFCSDFKLWWREAEIKINLKNTHNFLSRTFLFPCFADRTLTRHGSCSKVNSFYTITIRLQSKITFSLLLSFTQLNKSFVENFLAESYKIKTSILCKVWKVILHKMDIRDF